MNTIQQFWQQLPLHIDPVFIRIGSFEIYYYSLMYLLALFTVYLLARYRTVREDRFDMSKDELQGYISSLFIGVLIGARLGYVLFYNLSYYLQHPLEIILPFQIDAGWKFVGISGMSFHGGLLGVICAGWLYLKRHRLNFLNAVDFIIPCIPAGYAFGRLGNFINGELYGRVTQWSIGMMFPLAPGNQLRHPSQLYEMLGEGVLLFAILWLLRKRITLSGAMLPLYLIGYGTIRFFIEYTREADEHIGYLILGLSMGQILCLAMIIAGLVIFGILVRFRRSEST